MNEKITLPALVNLFALNSGETKKTSEDFIKAFFNEISIVLSEGDNVKIKDLGVFKTISVDARKSVNVSTGEDHEIPAHRKVAFVVSKELAAIVNEPFSMFETVELSENIEMQPAIDEALKEQNNEEIEIPENRSVEKPDEVTTDNVTTDNVVIDNVVSDNVVTDDEEMVDSGFDSTSSDAMLDDKEVKSEDESDLSELVNNSPEPSIVGIEEASDEIIEPITNDRSRSKLKFFFGFLTGILTACVILVVTLGALDIIDWHILFGSETSSAEKKEKVVVVDVVKPSSNISENKQAEISVTSEANANNNENSDQHNNEIINSDTKDDIVPTNPSDKKVYDTISNSRYLTTMAKDHYGNYHLWPYIYIENSSFLGHPDRIKPGTKVVIPDLKKYGVDPNNPDDIAKAKRKGVEIYSRYK